ncbi:hypothetical protein O1611_g8565 [Lasiodiplodia mahajangana]|uniref:Uncharacterized protein n=1 Tax=Lasiodiplodia mahajangana TaxID=1108764 RepID=A0ACC2JC63_9PEZI|nr:hypothetical protein O1611_g8565 [Lasiodiplodia mahajangana]
MEENLLVVEAPADSELNSPSIEETTNYVEPWVEDAEELDENSPESMIDESPPLAPSLAEWPEPGKAQPSEVDESVNIIGQDEEENEDYSSWIDNPEFKEVGMIATKTEPSSQ